MGAGGIIQNHSEVLLQAVSHPSIYDFLTDSEKDRVELIRAENPLARSQDDVNFLLDKLNEHCRR